MRSNLSVAIAGCGPYTVVDEPNMLKTFVSECSVRVFHYKVTVLLESIKKLIHDSSNKEGL